MNAQKLKQIQDEINRSCGSGLYANVLAFWKFSHYEYFAVGVWENSDKSLNCMSNCENGRYIYQAIFKFDGETMNIMNVYGNWPY